MKYLITLPAIYASLLLLCMARAPYAKAETYPVASTLGGIPFQTNVDSPIARDLILGDFALLPEELTNTLTTEGCHGGDSPPGRQKLRSVSRRFSPDTAMALLVRCLLGTPQVASAQALFSSALSHSSANDQNPAHNTLMAKYRDSYTVVLVPGWGYLEPNNPTGADLAMPRAVIEAQGFTTHLTPLASNTSVEEGAQVLGQLLRELLKGDKNVILVSASSGGPIVAHAIATQGIADDPKLRGWLNICGVLNGSPVIDSLLFWPATLVLRSIALFEGWSYKSLLSLSREKSVARYAGFSKPAHLTIVNYVGTPFSGQISQYGSLFKKLLKRKGPNDGLTYITEALAPGYTILGVGTDHFIMEDPHIEEKTRALLPVLLTLIEEGLARG